MSTSTVTIGSTAPPVSAPTKADASTVVPSPENKTPYVMVALAIVLIVIFALAILIYYREFNRPVSNSLLVVNQCPNSMNVMLSSGEIGLSTAIPPGGTYNYRVTPGFKGHLSAATDSIKTSCDGGPCPYTEARLAMAGDSNGYVAMAGQDGNFIRIPLLEPVLAVDTYDISLANGYNINMTIKSSGGTAPGTTCAGPTWTTTITAAQCPAALQIKDERGNFTACASACTASRAGGVAGTGNFCCTGFNCAGAIPCGTEWKPSAYYDAFAIACPDCAITNCDQPRYTCPALSRTELPQYTITLCAPVGT